LATDRRHGRGVIEVRVYTGREYRVLSVTRLPDAIHVVHAFEKRTRRTRRVDVDVARSRYRALMRRRID
jgi:phage-related protein